jgi:hypothetical protein
VPDWLRTGNIGSPKTDDDNTPVEKPKKDGASDLPEWLVHDSDPEPIINAPTTISTEFFQDLVDKSGDLPQPDDLFADEDAASLPDWLSDVSEPTEELDVRSGLTDWLSDLRDDTDEGETAVSSDEPEDVSGGLTDWLQELDDLNNPEDNQEGLNAAALEDLLDVTTRREVEPSDWLQELGPAQTDIFPGQIDDSVETENDELPSWMDELGPPQTNLLDPNQIAELTGPLTGLSDEEDLIDDESAGADVSFTDLFKTASGLTETLPDWLDTAAEEGETFVSDLPDELADDSEPDVVSEPGSDWFTADQIVAETDLDWLEETGNLENVADEDVLDALEADDFAFDEELELADEPTAEADETDDGLTLADDDFDWLSDMDAIQTGELIIEPDPESELDTEETAVPTDHTLASEEPAIELEPDEETWTSETFFAETAVNADLPDWLDQLDEAEPSETAEPDAASQELPDWIASMRPSQGFMGSELPDVFSDVDLRDTLEGIPEELAGAELPDWLQDTPLDNVPSAPIIETDKDEPMEIPDWLQPEAEETPEGATSPSSEPVEASSSRNEWRSLLEELPPLTPFAESLAKAEIPEWVQQLKPPELSGEPPRELEGPAETSGPLKGMQGIVAIEPVIARPRAATLPTPYVTTPEQQQQVALLQQLAQEMPETVTTLSAKSTYGTAVWLRISLTMLVFAALLAGLLGPSLVATDGVIPANVQAVETAVSTAAGQPVLVAVEYTPAMAGELSPQAELLLAQLAANGSPVLITSQYAAGTAVARNLTSESDVQFIGYLPGEGIGLRQLGDCLAGRNACDQLNGRVLDAELQASLSQTSLVIVLTNDRDNLVNWIEQVGAVATNVPLIAGVTQALTPLANSYTTTGQLSGLLGGTPDAAAYEQLVNVPDGDVQTQLNAQIYGQFLAGVLLLIGLLAYGVTGFTPNRRAKK